MVKYFWIGDESTSVDISKTISLGIQSHSNNPKLYFNLNFDNGVVSSDFEYNSWINVIGIFRGSSNKISLYIDGNLVSEQTSNVSSIDLSNLDQASINTIGNGFGNMNNLENFSGKMNNLSFWDRISEEEIQSYISCSLSVQEEGLIGYWNFNEGSGDTVYDLSGNEIMVLLMELNSVKMFLKVIMAVQMQMH